MLMRFYFGENAAQAERSASRQMKQWIRAFDRWITELQAKKPNAARFALNAWSRFAGQCAHMPWEVTDQDVDAHLRWMEQHGYDKTTINRAAGCISRFYDWCSAHRVDPSCPVSFNPARHVPRLPVSLYETSVTWSRHELQRLLELMERDSSPIGRRDLAFLKLRLSTGVRNLHLLNLQWGQVEAQGDVHRVSWRKGTSPMILDADAWQAITAYLQLSGRLGGMTAGKYIFSPLRYKEREDTGRVAADWVEDKPLDSKSMCGSLKIYGRQLEIDPSKLTWNALRMTAIRLRLESGETVDGMQGFMQSRSSKKKIRCKMKNFPPLAQDRVPDGDQVAPSEAQLPERHGHPFKPGHGLVHGVYAHYKDPQAVKAVMEEGIHGLEHEVEVLHRLMDGILTRGADDENIMKVYMLSVGRLSELSRFKRTRKEIEEQKKEDEFLARFDERAEGRSDAMTADSIRAGAAQWVGNGADPKLREVEATVRLMLRNVETASEQCSDDDEYLHLVDLYGTLCIRLLKLVRQLGLQVGMAMRYWDHILSIAIKQTYAELTEKYSKPDVPTPGYQARVPSSPPSLNGSDDHMG